MPNEFERQEVPSGSENPKEVKPVSEEYRFFMASVALSEVKKSEPKMSDEEALDYVVEHSGVNKVRFLAWLENSPKKSSRPAPMRGSKYTDEQKRNMWFNQGPMA